MGKALKLVTKDGIALRDLPDRMVQDPWQRANDRQRRVAELRFAIVRDCLEPRHLGAELLAENLLARIRAGSAPTAVAHAANALGKGLSVPNIKRWILAARKGGLYALLSGKQGKRRVSRSWEVRCLNLWDSPSKPGYSDIAFKLRMEGHAGVTGNQVSRYLKTLPKHLAGEKSIGRVGEHLHGLTRQHYQRRTTSMHEVGEIYAGDGHTVDCYVAHPNNGRGLFRPELTVFIDTASRYIVGWWLSESETKESTLFALSSAMIRHDHVPGWLYLDHGAGYRSQMLTDVQTGWFGKFEIAVTAAIPGNPHGKGWIERFFRTVRDKHDKFFADGLLYCGDDMAQETNRRLHIEVKQGRRVLPSVEAYKESFSAWLEHYHNEPMDVLGGQTPAQVFAGLQRVPVHVQHDAVMRPCVQRTVIRQEVRLHGRHYYNEVLMAYDGELLNVEYDLHNDALVWVRDSKGRLICEAELAKTIGVLPSSRLEEQRIKRQEGQLKRLEAKAHEAKLRSLSTVDVTAQQVQALEGMGALALENKPSASIAAPFFKQYPTVDSPAPRPTDVDSDIEIDILTWRDN